MTVTYFSFFTAIISGSLLVAALLKSKRSFFAHGMYTGYVLCCVFSVCRLFAVFEIPLMSRPTVVSEVVGTGIYNVKNAVPILRNTTFSQITLYISLTLVAIWLVVAASRVLRSVLSYRNDFVVPFAGSNECNVPHIKKALLEVKRDLRIRRHVRVLQIKDYEEPITTGFFLITVFLPTEVKNQDHAYALLRHELAHHKNGDIFTLALLAFARDVLFFIPLINKLIANIETAMEFRNDKAASLVECATFKYYYALSLQNASKAAQKAMKEREERKQVQVKKKFSWRLIFGMGQENLPPLHQGDLISERLHKVMSNEERPAKRMSFLVSLSLLITFCFASLAFTLPVFERVHETLPTHSEFSITPDNSYLIDNGDGTYSLYVEGLHFYNAISDPADYPGLPIKTK